MKSSTRTTLRVIAAANVIFFLIFLGLATPPFLHQWSLLRSWQRVEAMVLRSEVVPVPAASGDPLYDAHYTFGFILLDGPHTATIGSNHLSTSAARKQKQVARFPAGTRHVILYNPADPAEIRMQPGFNVHFFAVPIFIGGVGAIFGVIALTLFMVAGRKVRGAATATAA